MFPQNRQVALCNSTTLGNRFGNFLARPVFCRYLRSSATTTSDADDPPSSDRTWGVWSNRSPGSAFAAVMNTGYSAFRRPCRNSRTVMIGAAGRHYAPFVVTAMARRYQPLSRMSAREVESARYAAFPAAILWLV